MYKSIYDTLIIGKKVIYLPTCHSTNDIAAEIVRSGPVEEGTVVITDDQTNGRGQRGNIWQAEPGMNLTISIILCPAWLPIADQFLLSQAVSLGIWSYLSRYSGDVKIKWPNDIYLGRKKICGTLIESAIQGSRLTSSIAGIGVNINQTEFSNPRITSLAQYTNQTYVVTEEYEKLLRHIDAYYFKLVSFGNHKDIREQYRAQLFGYQKVCSFLYNNEVAEGMVMGVTPQGRLIVKMDCEPAVLEFNHKEIEWIWED